MSLDIEDVGSFVFEELAFDELGYESCLSECQILDHYITDKRSHLVVLLVNEIGKTPYKVLLETKVVSVVKQEVL